MHASILDSVVPIELSEEVLVLHGQITLGHQPLDELYLFGNLRVGLIPMLTHIELLITSFHDHLSGFMGRCCNGLGCCRLSSYDKGCS